MKVYPTDRIRNVALLGHSHCGKTQLAAAMFYTAGVTTRLTRVDDGNTLTDYDEEEIERRMTITTAVVGFEWCGNKINLLDTPGFMMFINDTRLNLAAADSCLVVVDATSGVEVITEKVWGFAQEFKLPRCIVVNKLDREYASFERALESLREAFGRTVVPIQLPIGSEKQFRGVVDLISMHAFTYEAEGTGKGKQGEIPGELLEQANKAREELIEFVAEGNDELLEKFFEKGTLSQEDFIRGLREAILQQRLFPVLCASALLNIGTDQLLNLVTQFMPNPAERPPVKGFVGEQEVTRAIADEEPFSAFVFKTVSDPYAGHISFFKIFSGKLENDTTALNVRSGATERLTHIGVPQGKNVEEVPVLHAGDIGAVAKLRATLTGDTLADASSPIRFEPVKLPEPAISFAIEPKSRQDEDRMGLAIQKILEEDPSLRFYRDPQTKEFLLSGMGSQHVEVAVSKLKRRYGVEVVLRAPKIPYRETIRGTADVQGKHKKQTGGHGQYGDCKIRMEPLPRGKNFEFVNAIFGGAIPKQFIPAVEKGILEAAAEGYLAGYPVVDFKVTLYDGSYHEVDSSELAFKLAARKAFRAAMEKAKPALLEPIMNVEIVAPPEFAGDLMGDINARRGRILGMENRGKMQVIRAQVPMAEMLTYQNDLIAMTQGRATFTMEFDHYDFVPEHIAQKIIAEARAARGEQPEEE